VVRCIGTGSLPQPPLSHWSRLRHFYNALKDLVGGPRETSVSIRSGDLSDTEDDCIANGNKLEEPKPVAGEGLKLPTFEELEALFERMMKEHKGEDGTKTFSWHSFIHALLRELGLDQLSGHEKVRNLSILIILIQ
jgi:hypothetical protein